MTKEIQSPNVEGPFGLPWPFRRSSFGFPSDFDIRPSDLRIAAHPVPARQAGRLPYSVLQHAGGTRTLPDQPHTPPGGLHPSHRDRRRRFLSLVVHHTAFIGLIDSASASPSWCCSWCLRGTAP